jgi:replicative DNA helicase
MTDKILPQAIDAERAVIGTCLSYPNAVFEISSIVTPDMFYQESHRQLYTAIIETARETGSTDIISVTNTLRAKGQLDNFGIPALVKFTHEIVTDLYLVKYAYIIREKHTLRQLINAGYKISSMAFESDLKEVIEYAESELFSISNLTQNKEPKGIDRCVDELLIEIGKIYNKEKSLVGVASGFTKIDRITGGWQPGNLIIIAGRPSMGKTALALSLLTNSANYGFPACMFSLEMSESELTGRLLSGVSGYTNHEIRNAQINYDKLVDDSNAIAVKPIYIDDTPALSIFELKSKIKKLIIRNGIKLAIVDYLQLMTSEGSNREQEVSKISRGLKAIAKEMNIPIIALSQLNRSVEDRSDKKPRLSDLRESGAIEQDADIVCFIHRPAYYGIRTVMAEGNEISSQDVMMIEIAKNRNGALNDIALYHNKSLTQISQEEIKPF